MAPPLINSLIWFCKNFIIHFHEKITCHLFTGITKANLELSENTYSEVSRKAYTLHPMVPKGILEAVSYSQTRFEDLGN
jgi:hypothetical protein